MRIKWRWSGGLCLALMLGCKPQGPQQSQRGGLYATAQKARQEGRSTARVSTIFDEFPLDKTLTEALRGLSVLIVIPSRPPVQTASPDYVYRWYTLLIDATLSHISANANACHTVELPPSLKPNPDEIVVSEVDGSVTIDGVEVMMSTAPGPVRFKPEQRYLVVGDICPRQVFGIGGGSSYVFEVTPDGRLSAATRSNNPIAKQIVDLGTIHNVSAEIDRVRAMR